MNAQHLCGPTAPDWVLLEICQLDFRYPSLDDGLSWPLLLTRYRLVRESADITLRTGERPRALGAIPASPTQHGSVASLPFSARAQISAAVGAQAATYRLTPSPGGFRAVSEGQHLTARFTRSGVLLRSGTTELGLSLRSVGYGDSLSPVDQIAPPPPVVFPPLGGPALRPTTANLRRSSLTTRP